MKAEQIREKALQLGAKAADWRKWKFRKRIPADWRERVFLASSGAISFKDMNEVFKKEK
jgi:hypothetical protein